MTLVVTHAKVSGVADDPGASAAGEVLPSDWNANHTLTGQASLAQGGTGADLSATGGSGQYVKQASAGGPLTVGTIPASDLASTGDLTRTNDTNVTLTLGGTPTGALLKATSLALGWTGTLALSRGGTAADLSATGGAGQYLKQATLGGAVTVGTIPASDIASSGNLTSANDTNVTVTLGGTPTGSLLKAASITMGWTGTLAASRGGFGADVSAQSGVPLFATGVATFTGTTGSGNFVRASSPTLITPALGTPSSGTLTNCTAFTLTTTGTSGAATYSAGTLNIPQYAGGVTSLNGQTGALTLFSQPQGRVTLSTGVAVMTSTVSGATTVYYTPSNGNICPIYDGTNMVPTVFSELSQLTTDTTKSPAACTTNSNYDIFVWNDGGTIRATRGPAWSSNTSRGTGVGTSELQLVNGIYLNKNAITNGPAANRGTYVGTIRTNGTSTVDYSVGGSGSGGVAGSLGVWNMYNRNLTTATSIDSGASYTYSSATVRQARGSAGNQCSVLAGLTVDTLWVNYSTRIDTTATSASFSYVGIGEDTTTANTSQRVFIRTVAAVVMIGSPYVSLSKTPLLGYHTYSANEAGDGSDANTMNTDSTATLTLTVWN